MGNTRCLCLEQLHLGLSSSCQARQHLAARFVPLGQLGRGHLVRVLFLVQPLDQGRGACVSAPNVEGPADQGAILVGVELNGVLDLLADALSCRLELMLAAGARKLNVAGVEAYQEIFVKELLAVSLR